MFFAKWLLSEVPSKKELHHARLESLYSGYFYATELSWLFVLVAVFLLSSYFYTREYGALLCSLGLVVLMVAHLIRARKWVHFRNKHSAKADDAERRYWLANADGS